MLYIPFINASEIQGTVLRHVKGLANSVVYIKKIEGQTFTPPDNAVVLDQIGLKFIPHVLPILAGTTVEFPNQDDVLHNVFSPGRLEKFNLGTYPIGTNKTRHFPEPGIVLLLCNLHHEMSAFIIVVETPYYAVTDIDGKYTIKNVPPGKYLLAAWYEDVNERVKEIEVPDQGLITIDFLMKDSPID